MENINEKMKTLSQVMAILAKRGLTKEFRMNDKNNVVLKIELKLQRLDPLGVAHDFAKYTQQECQQKEDSSQ